MMRRLWVVMAVCMALLGAPARAEVRAGLGGFFWSLDTPQANTLHGVVAAQPEADGRGLLAVGDASTFLIRRSPIQDAASGWLAGRGRPVHVDTSYRGVARSTRTGLIGIAASDGTALVGDGNSLASLAIAPDALNSAVWFDADVSRLALLGDNGAAYTFRPDTGAAVAATTSVPFGTPAFRRACSLPDSAIGYAAAEITSPNGAYGILLKTTDSGQTWSWLPNAPMLSEYRDVSFVTPSVGFALGVSGGVGTIYRTSSGGAAWSILGTVDAGSRALAAFDAERLVVVGENGIAVSTGRGQFQSVPEPVTGLSAPVPLEDVDVAGPEAWAVGQGGVIFLSVNHGTTWSAITRSGSLDASQLKPWNAIQYLSTKDVYVAGDDGTVRRSEDGGLSFQTVPTGISSTLFALAAPGQRNAGQGAESTVPGVAVGAQRTILTYDASTGGWSTAGAIPRVDYFGVSMLLLPDGPRTWVVGANGTIVASAGDDPLWHQQGSGTTSTLRAVHAVANGTAPAVVAVGDAGTILKSTNGITWGTLTPFAGAAFTRNLRGVYFRDALTGFVVGDGGTILRTLDGGKSWSYREAPTEADLYAVAALPADGAAEVYAVGEHQTVLKSTDNGTSWSRLIAPINNPVGTPPPDFTYRTVQVTGTGRVYIAGDDSHRLRSLDGGTTWTETDGQSGVTYTALRLLSASKGVSVANGAAGPAVAVTTTMFTSTSAAALPPAPALYAADGRGAEIILAGADGTILRTTNANYSSGAAFGDVAADIRAVASPVSGAYAAAGGSEAFFSKDDGVTWKAAVVNNPYGPGVRFRAIGFGAPDGSGGATGYLAGGIPGQNVPVLFESADGGETWNPVALDFGADNAGITALGVFSGTVLATAENGAVYVQAGGAWQAQRPLPNYPGPWLAVSADDSRWYITGARGRAARYPDADGNPNWQALNTGTVNDITAISGPPPAGLAMAASGGSGQSLRDDVRGVSMRPEGVLLTGTGGLALFGDLDQNALINAADAVSSMLSISGGQVPDDDGYFFGDIFPPVPGPDILPGDGFLDIRDATRVVRKTQGLD